MGGESSIPDNYRTIEEVQQALRRSGLEGSNIIVGVDYTMSNLYQVLTYI
jgi:hypothetical protein